MKTSKQVLEDAEAVYVAWQEAPSGSYLERTLERSIASDIAPSMIHLLREYKVESGFVKEEI